MSTPWRADPRISTQFHPEYPDDIQVVVHQGGPRLSKLSPELMWVRLTGQIDGAYEGTLLNTPHQLTEVRSGMKLLVLVAAGAPHPIRTTPAYLKERATWNIVPCQKCGMAELFDPPSALMAKVFPGLPAGATIQQFTSFCPICGGVQGVMAKAGAMPAPTARPWWQFWKA